MIRGENKILQAFLGTLVTWGLTAAGSAVVFVFNCRKLTTRKILDGSLGFAGGVMIAASFWSLLAPAIESAVESGTYGDKGQFAFGPVCIGFLLGCAFVLCTDLFLPCLNNKDPSIALAEASQDKKKDQNTTIHPLPAEIEMADRKHDLNANEDGIKEKGDAMEKWKSWKRLLILMISITVHNIPEGLAIGVGFAAIGSSKSATFESARNLALGIGIQNFPEGMAVSVPLAAAGYHPFKAFLYGQLSGLVEPIFGVIGALIASVAKPVLCYALSFGAGAMIYVVFDNIVPESNLHGNGRISTWGAMSGFIIMMCLEIGLAF